MFVGVAFNYLKRKSWATILGLLILSLVGGVTGCNQSDTPAAAVAATPVPTESSDLGDDYLAENICTDKTIADLAGTAICQSAAGGTVASAASVLDNKFFWDSTGASIEGTMVNHGAVTISSDSDSYTAGYVSSIAVSAGQLSAGNVCNGKTILGVAGGAACIGASGSGPILTALDICSGNYAFGSTGSAMQGSKTCAMISSSSGFTPSSVSGLVFWVTADSLTTLANGDYVRVWPDLSSTNRSAVNMNSGTGSLPTIVKSGGGLPNSKPILRFDGDDDKIIAIFDLGLPVSDGGTVTVFFVSANQSNFPFPSNDQDSLLGTRVTGAGTDGFSVTTAGDWATSTNSPLVYSGSFDGGAWTWGDLQKDGASVSQGSTTTVGQFNVFSSVMAGADSQTDFYIGTTASSGYGGKNDIAEIIIYDGTISAPNRQAIECYLGEKYNITVSGCL